MGDGTEGGLRAMVLQQLFQGKWTDEGELRNVLDQFSDEEIHDQLMRHKRAGLVDQRGRGRHSEWTLLEPEPEFD